MYKLTTEGNVIIRLSDKARIPVSERNKDYQKYLKWLEQGNTPQPPDPEPLVPDLKSFVKELRKLKSFGDWRKQSRENKDLQESFQDFIILGTLGEFESASEIFFGELVAEIPLDPSVADEWNNLAASYNVPANFKPP